MGFFSNLREDIAQAVNELTEENADKEIQEATEQIKMDLEAMEGKDYLEMHAESVNEHQANEIEDGNNPIAIEQEEPVVEEEPEVPVEERRIEIIPRDVENIDEIMASEETQAMEEAFEEAKEEVQAEILEESVEAPANEIQKEVKEESDDSIDELLEFIDNNSIDDLLVLDGADESEMEEVKNEYGEINTIDEDKLNQQIEEALAKEKQKEEERRQRVMESMASERKSKAKSYTEVKGKEKVKPKETIEISPEHTVITTGTTITGDINSKGDVEVYGGKVVGTIESECRVIVGSKSVIMGDIIAKGAIISGAVKGDIDVHGTVVLESTAVVYGNIKSESLEINNGAVTEGLCSQCYAKNNPKDFFDKFSE